MYTDIENSEILGMATVVPSSKRTLEECRIVFGDKKVDRFFRHAGVRSVHRSAPEQTAADLGYEAVNQLLHELEIDRAQIGVLLFVTLSPDYRRPPTSCVLQHRLGLSVDCAVLDIYQGCSGFVYGHTLMQSMLLGSNKEYGVLICAETSSKIVAEDDPSAMLLGDGGAALCYRKGGGGRCCSLLRTDGTRFSSIILPAGGFREIYAERKKYLCSDGVCRSKYDVFMDGMSVMLFSINDVPEAILEYLEQTRTDMAGYDLIVFHQANKYIINQLIKKLHLPEEKVPISLDRYGNTASVSIPLSICDYFEKCQKSRKICSVLAVGFGVGLSWGVTSFEIAAESVLPVTETESYYKQGYIDLNRM